MAANQPVSLADALRFTPEDLDANRAGKLSDAQRARLTSAARRTQWTIIGVVLALMLAAALLVYLGRRGDNAVLSLIGVALTAVNAVVIVYGVSSVRRLRADAHAARIDITAGRVKRIVRVYSRLPTYLLKVADQEFFVSKTVFAAFSEGASYRLYRLPVTRTLLSAELTTPASHPPTDTRSNSS